MLALKRSHVSWDARYVAGTTDDLSSAAWNSIAGRCPGFRITVSSPFNSAAKRSPATGTALAAKAVPNVFWLKIVRSENTGMNERSFCWNESAASVADVGRE